MQLGPPTSGFQNYQHKQLDLQLSHNQPSLAAELQEYQQLIYTAFHQLGRTNINNWVTPASAAAGVTTSISSWVLLTVTDQERKLGIQSNAHRCNNRWWSNEPSYQPTSNLQSAYIESAICLYNRHRKAANWVHPTCNLPTSNLQSACIESAICLHRTCNLLNRTCLPVSNLQSACIEPATCNAICQHRTRNLPATNLQSACIEPAICLHRACNHHKINLQFAINL